MTCVLTGIPEIACSCLKRYIGSNAGGIKGIFSFCQLCEHCPGKFILAKVIEHLTEST